MAVIDRVTVTEEAEEEQKKMPSSFRTMRRLCGPMKTNHETATDATGSENRIKI